MATICLNIVQKKSVLLMKKNKITLSDVWIKASLIGTIWAASEIVLGSFLHNLKIPFSGNILTGIGIILLISFSYKWKDKGLFWRAGLICAIMKTMSPSAVIFGPMIAIFSQSLLLETSTRLFGKTILGFTLGAMFAMSWNLFQKIINFILFYGMNIIKVYESLIHSAQKQLYIQSDILWLPILFLLIIYCILGIITALAGMKIGKKIIALPVDFKPVNNIDNDNVSINKKQQNFPYSLGWLVVSLILMIGSFLLIKTAHWFIWTSIISAVVFIWTLRYKRAIRQLMKPKFWMFFVVITMITTYVFTKIQGSSIEEGLLTGLEMNFRAILIIVGFTVLGTELYNPKIQEFFLKTSFKQLPTALELSFESLPMMIAAIPDVKSLLKNPVSIIHQIIMQAEYHLQQIKKKQLVKKTVFIITGIVGEGKTKTIKLLINQLQKMNIAIGGFYSPRLIENNSTIGYDIIDIQSNKQIKFLRTHVDNREKIGRFSILNSGLIEGVKLLEPNYNLDKEIVVIDEIGKLELQGKGWTKSFNTLLKNNKNHLLISVRKDFKNDIIKKWKLENYQVFDVGNSKVQSIFKTIHKSIKS